MYLLRSQGHLMVGEDFSFFPNSASNSLKSMLKKKRKTRVKKWRFWSIISARLSKDQTHLWALLRVQMQQQMALAHVPIAIDFVKQKYILCSITCSECRPQSWWAFGLGPSFEISTKNEKYPAGKVISEFQTKYLLFRIVVILI